ncbi:outer membrane protein assembly factor BamB family protein [Streptomyces sp. GQFP]|uniref:outer membrane protein assembly factor BamB family protein n=1 Tax=Streptomyces sp. GQFP TaxID=2907545 RepID=UPI001F1802F5|nr:PQQ-binding-like beta-propeller repeat protein [Streptomyces sp. GQFP]UIX34688.1 PQQ-like beta-propeller repeat protein [Streptomyces sp. GQFP]
MTVTDGVAAGRFGGRRRFMVLGAGGLAAVAGGVGTWRLLDGDAEQWPWEQVWSEPVDGVYPSALNAHAGVLYLSGFGGVTAVEQSRGGKRWQALSDLDSQSAPAFGADVVCITGVRTGGRTVVNGIEASSGRMLWEREVDGLTQYAPTPAGDIMLVVIGRVSVASDTVVHAFDARSGQVRWSTRLPAKTVGPSAPVTGNGLVHLTTGVFTEGSMAWTLDLATGALRWKSPSEGFLGAPVLAGRELHMTASPSSGSADEGHNAFVTLDAVSGKDLRRAGNLPVGSELSVQRVGGTLYAAVRRYGDQYHSTLVAVDVSTGRLRWQADTDIDMVRTFRVSGDTVLAGGKEPPETTGSYLVQVFDADTGRRRWTRDMGTHVSLEGPVLTDGTVCVPTRAKEYTNRGTLNFLDLASGTTRWRHPLSTSGNAIACPDGRTLYVLAMPFPQSSENTLESRQVPTLYALRRRDS